MEMTDQHPTLSWFDDHISFSEEHLKQTLVQVAGCDTGACEVFLRSLVSPPANISRPVLELLLASSECRALFWKCLEDDFPVIPDYFSTDLTAIMVLKKISFSVPFLHAFDRETNMNLNNYTAKVQHAPEVIEALSRFIDTSNSIQELDDDQPDAPTWRVKQTQRSRKNARTRPVIFDSNISRACEFLNLSIPTTITDAMQCRHALAQDLSTIFKFYCDLLQDPAVESTLRNSFIQLEPSVAVDLPVPQTVATQNTEVSPDSNQYVNSAFPMVQPMKAALYFESAEGFGEWRILISTRADRNLRDARRRDKKFFTIIVKKIKELSNGHFSDDNQKWLSGSQTEIPIYEAKMTRDSRLIYQIDCIPEYDTDVERQVVKIFGVYTHAQIDKRLWGSLSHQLMKRGTEYRRRCCFRNQPVAGDKHFSPGCFPPMEQDTEDDQAIPTIPFESLEEIHSLLVLEKFVTFSQALLNSIIADLDIAHVFDVSPGEMEIIQHPYSCYVLGRSGTGKTTTMLFKMLGIQRAYEQCKDTMPKPRQIFVTQSRVLAAKVEEYFTKLLESLSTGQKTKEELAVMIKFKRQQQQDKSLVDADDDQNWRPDLPLKYSNLRDEHFPLFLTFDRLASLLEADFGITSDPDERSLLTYDRFLDEYWPHFAQPLKKGLDPALVYSEIIGVIGGSEESLAFDSCHIDKETYENLSARTQYAFSSQREIIYALFQTYQKRKRLFSDLDAADRAHRILHEFRVSGVPGDRFDFLYVDEAQDNLLIDALLLRSLVRNPNGMFWAGDTAQTISLGSSFRFNDLKAFLFRSEKRREASRLSDGVSLIQEEPKTFHLTKNYRSHGGIVRCAQSVIELITNFWPNAIDVLSREVGVVDGCKPVFFSGWDSSTVRYEQFLFGESGNPVEFGAQQCILVRNEAAREELRLQVGKIGLILTLYESKGLEFDDVLLYKFFEDSSFDLSQWRIVLNMLNDDDGVVVTAPTFDNSRHAGVCTELKFLYVAITRARKNLWIVDCSEKSEPMRVFWNSRNEIQCCTPGSDVPRLAVSSTPQEWEETGRTLFINKRYSQAMHCFERAGLDREAAVAHAYFLRENARATARHDSSKQGVIPYQKAFCAAAESFLKCAQSAINSKERDTFLRNAAECLERADEDFRAAEVYKQAQEFTKAAKLYRKTAKFDEAIAVVTENRSQVAEEVAENIIVVAKLFYFKSGELEKAGQLFKSVEEQLKYLEDFDLDVSRAALYEKIRDYPAAAAIHLAEGRTFDAIKLFLKDSSNQASILRGKDCILHGLWENLSFGTKLTERNDDVRKLLTLATASLKPQETVNSKVGDELSMFMSLQSQDLKGLRALGTKFASQENLTSALFCLDHAFNTLPTMYGWAAMEVSHFLQDFLVFCQTLYRVASVPNPGQDPNVRKLFRILSSNNGYFLLPVGTFLYNKMIETRVVLMTLNERGALISEGELARGFKSALLNRLRSKLEDEGHMCKQATAFQPCIPFTINNGHCNRWNCPNEHPANPLGEEWALLRIKIHLQQLLVMRGLRQVSIPSDKRISELRWWISSLFSTLFPPMLRLGHFANLSISKIPEACKAFPIIEGYCKDLIYWPHYSARDPNLLTTSYQVARIAFFLNRTQLHPEIQRSPLNTLLSSIPEYRRLNDGIINSILPELLWALNGTQGIHCGIRVLDHILQKTLPIDANVLMDLVDIICGSLILLRKHGNLHNVTLPLSTFNNLVRIVKIDLNVKPSNITAETNAFLLSLKSLLNIFVTHQKQLSHILHERSNLYNLVVYHPVFISRICRAMCLLGYNVNNDNLRLDIIKSIKTLKNLKPIHNLVRDYASVWRWSDVARTMVSDTPLDQMIQLYHASKFVHAKPAPKGIRRIIYKNIDDIPKLLDGSLAFSTLRSDAPTFVPKRLAEAPIPESEEGEIEVEEPEVDNTEIINSAPLTESITITEIPEDNHPALEKQDWAARVLQTAYRRKLRGRKYRKFNHRITVLDNFQQYLAEASEMDWPKGSFYRLLYLGPVPHLQVCLNTAFDWVMENKQRNKKRFRTAIHQELDDINKRLTEQKKIIDELRILQKEVNPQSQLHRRRDAEELGKVVLQVQDMLRRVAPAVAKDVEEDMQMAIKGIVTKKAPKSKQKPVLNVDDVYHTDDDPECFD